MIAGDKKLAIGLESNNIENFLIRIFDLFEHFFLFEFLQSFSIVHHDNSIVKTHDQKIGFDQDINGSDTEGTLDLCHQIS